MCMIVDANVLGMFLLQPKNPDTAPIQEWLQRGAGSIVYSVGGKFQTDIDAANRNRLAELVRAGRARLVPWERVEPHEAGLGNIRSDDPARPRARPRRRRPASLYEGQEAPRGFQGREVHRRRDLQGTEATPTC